MTTVPAGECAGEHGPGGSRWHSLHPANPGPVAGHDALESGSGVISFQVVQEVLNVVTSRMAKPLGPQDAGELLDTVCVTIENPFADSA